MPLRPIFYDTETTGINVEKDSIVEIAAYDPIAKKSFSKLVNPQRTIPQESINITGITNEMVRDAENFDVVGAEFIKFCEGNTVLIAHNNDNFDLPIIRNSFKRYSLEMPQSWKFIDTLKWARKYRTDLPRHTLQFLRETYGVDENNAHRALDDTIVLYKVFKAMTNGLPVDTIYDLLNKAKNTSSMPFGKYKGWPLEKIPKGYVKWLFKNDFFEKPENQPLLKKFKDLGVL